MKKVLSLFVIPIISLFFVTEVKAEEYTLNLENHLESLSELELSFISTMGNELYDLYISSYSDIYPYFSIGFWQERGNFATRLDMFKEYPSSYWYGDNRLFYNNLSLSKVKYCPSGTTSYSDCYYESDDYLQWADIVYLDFRNGPESSDYNFFLYYYSNYNLYLPPNPHYAEYYDNLLVPKLDDPSIYNVVSFDRDDFFIEPSYLYYDINGLEFVPYNYTIIDLNNYSYVALSLKDYDVEAFDSVFYVKGQLCPTVVYGYGLEERLNTDRCNIAYDDFTPIRYGISNNDIKNHFIYYFKAYDTSIENKVKVDTSIFNIHYITEEEKDNPILDINGHKYSAIPFDKLPTTANKNELENFVPGASEKVTIESFFENPLELLKSVWGAIQSIFIIIAEFILLLPPVMQGFLYTAFGICIVLGIIKILL